MCSHFLQHPESLTVRLTCSRLSPPEERVSNGQVVNTDQQGANQVQEVAEVKVIRMLLIIGSPIIHRRVNNLLNPHGVNITVSLEHLQEQRW